MSRLMTHLAGMISLVCYAFSNDSSGDILGSQAWLALGIVNMFHWLDSEIKHIGESE